MIHGQPGARPRPGFPTSIMRWKGIRPMKWHACLLTLAFSTTSALAQEPEPLPTIATTPPSDLYAPLFTGDCGGSRPYLASNHNFPNFIGWISNPVQNIDPRSLTQMWPVFANTSIS